MPKDDVGASERAEAILSELGERRRVSVRELAAKLGVSTVTVRKDLVSLEERRLLARVHGAAVIPAHTDEGPFGARVQANAPVKRAIGRAAAKLVQDGDSIAIDSSTTAYQMALNLLDRKDLLVVTTSLRVAMLFMERSTADIVIPGGMVRRASAAVVGGPADFLAGRGRVPKGFFGLTGLSPEHGLLELVLEETEAKRALVGICEQVIALCAADKFGGLGLHSFVPAARVTAIYTDLDSGAEALAPWHAQGTAIHTVQR
jgi:DeoR/GlpR family transcriptional regulator of sugar metabolism